MRGGAAVQSQSFINQTDNITTSPRFSNAMLLQTMGQMISAAVGILGIQQGGTHTTNPNFQQYPWNQMYNAPILPPGFVTRNVQPPPGYLQSGVQQNILASSPCVQTQQQQETAYIA